MCLVHSVHNTLTGQAGSTVPNLLTEPSLSTSIQGKQGVQGAYALVRGRSSVSKLLESLRTTFFRDSKVYIIIYIYIYIEYTCDMDKSIRLDL